MSLHEMKRFVDTGVASVGFNLTKPTEVLDSDPIPQEVVDSYNTAVNAVAAYCSVLLQAATSDIMAQQETIAQGIVSAKQTQAATV